MAADILNVTVDRLFRHRSSQPKRAEHNRLDRVIIFHFWRTIYEHFNMVDVYSNCKENHLF
jgi:hypothetical protein